MFAGAAGAGDAPEHQIQSLKLEVLKIRLRVPDHGWTTKVDVNEHTQVRSDRIEVSDEDSDEPGVDLQWIDHDCAANGWTRNEPGLTAPGWYPKVSANEFVTYECLDAKNGRALLATITATPAELTEGQSRPMIYEILTALAEQFGKSSH